MATIKDVVLIHMEDTPVSFARIESIVPDHKKDWYQITLLMLQIPLQVVTWILKGDYINGDDFFMNGKKMRLELVECPVQEIDTVPPAPAPAKKEDAIEENLTKPSRPTSKGKIISFSDLKNNQKDPESDPGPEPEIG